ncbi:hypothetical protein ES705_25159 [subsurface metagenome]
MAGFNDIPHERTRIGITSGIMALIHNNNITPGQSTHELTALFIPLGTYLTIGDNHKVMFIFEIHLPEHRLQLTLVGFIDLVTTGINNNYPCTLILYVRNERSEFSGSYTYQVTIYVRKEIGRLGHKDGLKPFILCITYHTGSNPALAGTCLITDDHGLTILHIEY